MHPVVNVLNILGGKILFGNYNFSLSLKLCQKKKKMNLDVPDGPVVKTSPSNAEGVGLIPGQGTKIPHAPWPKTQKTVKKQCYNKFNKDLKNGLYIYIKQN